MSRTLLEDITVATPSAPQPLNLRATAHSDREEALSRLRQTLDHCRGYLLEDRNTGPSQAAWLFEVPRRAVFDLYSGLLSAEFDLCRDSHLRLSGLCTLRRHHPLRGGNVTILLELSFFDATLPDDLWTSIGFA